MLCMFFTNLLDAEIVDGEGELYRPRGVFPEAWCVGYFIISFWAEALSEELVCEDSSLWESVDCFADFEVDKSILCMSQKLILVDG